jgi:hypothetical protein
MESMSTPQIRSDESSHSRAGEVAKHVREERFQGVLGSDMCVGHTIHKELHQRW